VWVAKPSTLLRGSNFHCMLEKYNDYSGLRNMGRIGRDQPLCSSAFIFLL